MSGIHTHTTQTVPAYEPQKQGITRAWLLIVIGLLVAAVGSVSMRRICEPDTGAASEAGFGVRHEQRGTIWYHCEPWIATVLTD